MMNNTQKNFLAEQLKPLMAQKQNLLKHLEEIKQKKGLVELQIKEIEKQITEIQEGM